MPKSKVKTPNQTPRTRRSGDRPAKQRKTSAKSLSKTAGILSMLKCPNGAALGELTQATDWQPHSVRGFLAGHVKKKLGLSLLSEVGANGVRRYRLTS